MVLKIWPLLFVLLLTILFSGIAYGDDIKEMDAVILNHDGTVVDASEMYDMRDVNIDGTIANPYGQRTLPDSSLHEGNRVEIPSIYFGDGYGEDEYGKNLIIGGISQKGPKPSENPDYVKFADANHAIYVPTYYSGNMVTDASSVETSFQSGATKNGELARGATISNGLRLEILYNKEYDTIIGYSGGTASAIMALDKQGVKCKTLILISPMKGLQDSNDYDQIIQRILNDKKVDKIVVLQSEKDTPSYSELIKYQAKFTKGADLEITVIEVPLKKTGNDGHIEMFFTYAMENIKNGVYVDPQNQGVAPAVQSFNVAPLSVAFGDSFIIDYTVSDIDGSGLKQVELWRKDESSDWQEIKRNELSNDNGPVSGSFTDSPSAPGKYWYGVHVVDNAGNWNDEKNSNTNHQPNRFEPVEVEVIEVEKNGATIDEVGNVVLFPDPNLETVIREVINKPEGAIYAADLEDLTHIYNAGEREIRDITGLEYCTNLQSLGLDSNQISDVSPLAGLTNLQYLNLYFNQILDVSPLAGLTNLQTLYLFGNQISDVSPLAGLTNLEDLVLFGNQISDVSPLAGLTNLEVLDLLGNQISDLSPLAGLTNLHTLNLDSNQISDVSPLAGLTNLQHLDLCDNQISDVSPLARLTNLQTLNLYFNQILDVSPLAGLKAKIITD